MKKEFTVSVALCLAMLSSAVLTRVLTPTTKMILVREKTDLETMIPKRFDGWEIDPSVVPVQVSAAVEASLDALYNQTLARTYINRRGERVMLSVAYGGDQSGNLALHKPEQCYTAQGFDVSKVRSTEMQTRFGDFPVTRLLARQGPRHEPISYWTTVGDKTVKNGLEQKILKVRYGLTGQIPDGMLVRVSTLQANEDESYAVQGGFIKAMLAALSAKDRERLVGLLQASDKKPGT